MKKIILGAALLLLMSATRASADNRTTNSGNPRLVHNILSTELPAALQTDIKTTYKGYWITELSEEGKAKHPDYSLTLENADQVVDLRSNDSENWTVVSTTLKL